MSGYDLLEQAKQIISDVATPAAEQWLADYAGWMETLHGPVTEEVPIITQTGQFVTEEQIATWVNEAEDDDEPGPQPFIDPDEGKTFAEIEKEEGWPE